jgi:glycosyltransferase involved in cell wall biosynthesis
MKLRIGHLIDLSVDTAYFRAVAKHTDRGRFEPVIGSLAAPGTLQEAMLAGGISTFALGLSPRSPRAVLSLAALLRREHIDLLHAHCFLPTLWGLAAARLARVPFVFTRHHSDHHLRLGRRLPVALDSWCAKLSDRVIAVSEATRTILVETEGVPEPKVVVVHNGMDPLTPGSAEDIARLRSSLGLSTEQIVGLVPARLHEEKGHATLFEALPRVMARLGDMVLLLAGDGGGRQSLEAEAARLGVGDKVRFLGRRADIANLMLLADLVVVPSLAESFGFVALEAMSLGRPLVVSSAGGLPEIVLDGETGLVFPKGDASSLAEAVISLMSEPSRARRLGDAGVVRARLFSATRMVSGYEAVYEEVLGKNPGNRRR